LSISSLGKRQVRIIWAQETIEAKKKKNRERKFITKWKTSILPSLYHLYIKAYDIITMCNACKLSLSTISSFVSLFRAILSTLPAFAFSIYHHHSAILERCTSIHGTFAKITISKIQPNLFYFIHTNCSHITFMNPNLISIEKK